MTRIQRMFDNEFYELHELLILRNRKSVQSVQSVFIKTNEHGWLGFNGYIHSRFMKIYVLCVFNVNRRKSIINLLRAAFMWYLCRFTFYGFLTSIVVNLSLIFCAKYLCDIYVDLRSMSRGDWAGNTFCRPYWKTLDTDTNKKTGCRRDTRFSKNKLLKN